MVGFSNKNLAFRRSRGAARDRESIASARAARMTNAAEEAAIARIVADVKALEMARGGKGSSTLRPGEKAEQVEPGQMVEVSNHSCLPQQKVEVVAADSAWSLGMPLAVFPFLGNCRDDPALCCYACCFPVCLHAEIAEYNGIEGLCHTKSALAQACCVECTAFSMIASFPLSGGLCFPLLCCVPSTRGARTDGRGAFERGSARRVGSARGAVRRAVSFPSQVRIHRLLYHGPRRLQAQVRAARRRVLRRAPDVVFVPSVWDTRWCSWWPLLLVASVILQLALYPRIHGVCELPEWALLQARVAHQARLRVLLVQARRHSHFWYRADATAKRAPRRAPCRGQLPLRVDTSRRRAELVRTLQFSLRSRGTNIPVL